MSYYQIIVIMFGAVIAVYIINNFLGNIFVYAFAQTGYVRYVLTYFQNSDEDIDTLVLGASHARSAIDPQKIDDVNDTNSFSLAIPGEMVKDSYYVLQEACRSKKIKPSYLLLKVFLYYLLNICHLYSVYFEAKCLRNI